MNRIDYFPVLSSLVAGELAWLRKCSSLDAELNTLSPSTEIGSGDLYTDSLELLQLASAVDQMFHLHETGVEEYLLRYRKLSDWAEIVSTSLQKKAERLTFRTSGSTGKPKSCEHRIADLEQEVEVHAALFPDCGRILTLVPLHHIYGFIWTVMLPQQLGVEILDVRRWSPSKLFNQLRSGDLLIGTPTVWQNISDSVGSFLVYPGSNIWRTLSCISVPGAPRASTGAD
ncbi:MAG: AMP-binding protein [Bryobacteraceae bacterium]